MDDQNTGPRIVGDSAADGAPGAVWSLAPDDRTLDANVIWLPAGDGIAAHQGPDLDVLVHIIDGSGTLVTGDGEIALTTGVLAWLPPRSRRAFAAGPDGLRYLTVHQRKTKPAFGLRAPGRA
ncbi:MAG: cupin domain-containing protein [Microbacterium gubbeenense]|uniref:cupin domain-containing protein n=3 Tax=Microbacterium gubbeenense TaxID=159896 RepID=UPI003F9D6BED